jgi:hypothetical protein
MTKPQPMDSVPAGYLPRREALAALGISDATLDRLVKQGELRSRLAPRAGRKPERVYLAEDVEKRKREGEERRRARPPSAIAVSSRGGRDGPFVPFDGTLTIRAMQTALRALETRPLSRPQVELKDKLWLSLDEAVAYSGLAKADLLFVCQESLQAQERTEREQLIVRKSGGWKILRRSLEAFEG